MDILIGWIELFLDFMKNIPEYLQTWAVLYGVGLYAILALIIFAETGLVVTPFLPGDSLLFAAGAVIAHVPELDLTAMCFILTLAAFFGNMVNYHVGRYMAPRLFANPDSRWLNKNHLQRTKEFYEKHGGKAVILTRFLPIIRTYAPFVAGLSGMNYKHFFVYNLAGGAIWVVSFLVLGYFFGGLPIIKQNFQYVILGIIIVSVIPVVYEWWKLRAAARAR